MKRGLCVIGPEESLAEFETGSGRSRLARLRLAEPGEFTRRAYLNGKLDLAQAESVADLIEAASAQAARAAVRSLDGAFSSEVHALRDELVHRGRQIVRCARPTQTQR